MSDCISSKIKGLASRQGLLDLYYCLKPLIPRGLQLAMRRQYARAKLLSCAGKWPIDSACGGAPPGWGGWPDGKKFALVLTHDVDTPAGYAKCRSLAKLETDMGFRSSFNFVAEAYRVEPELRQYLGESGFEVGLHGIRHDGKLYKSRKEFERNARLINIYLKEWECAGFRSPSMHCVLDWIHELDIEYDCSTFDTDPFEPRPFGTGRIFPSLVSKTGECRAFVELPYTLPQDFTLFVLMRHRDISVWKEKLDWVARRGAMALVNVHPDYICFNGGKCGREEYPARFYREFLDYVDSSYYGRYWHALPRDVARYWAGACLNLDEAARK